MSARRSSRGGGRRRQAAATSHDEERWLLTYADMITLLMALFMVLFSIASVNKSKLDVLTKALQEAFSGKILPGGTSFEKAGGFAPTMGILGTVMGLVHVLENLAAPSTLGPAISGAFIATLYGVGSANVIFLPTANKLKSLSAEEIELRSMTLEGILSIQAGDNPRVVADKLLSFIPPSDRLAAETDAEADDMAAMAPAEPELAAA